MKDECHVYGKGTLYSTAGKCNKLNYINGGLLFNLIILWDVYGYPAGVSHAWEKCVLYDMLTSLDFIPQTSENE